MVTKKELVARIHTLEHLLAELSYISLEEFASYCHYSIFGMVIIPSGEALATSGWIPIDGTQYPTRLESWDQFMYWQLERIRMIRENFSDSRKVFSSYDGLEYFSSVVRRMNPIGRGRDLTSILDDILTTHVIRLFRLCEKEAAICQTLKLRNAIMFSSCKTDVDMLAETKLIIFKPDLPVGNKQNGGGWKTAAAIMALRSPEKLTVEMLRHELRSMDVLAQVISRKDSGPGRNNELERTREPIKALTQLFHYMIQDGLKYGCLIAGLAHVFVKVELTYDSENNSTTATAFFHISEPMADVVAHEGDLNYSALLQVTAFILGAVDECSREDTNAKLRRADWATKLPYWRTSLDGDWSMPAAEFEAERRPPLRPERRTHHKCAALESDDERSTTGNGLQRRIIATVAPMRPRTRSQTKAVGNSRTSIASGRQYCTQACLLGLVTGDVLDETCPNVALHRRTETGDHHPVDYTTWLDLFRRQLRKGMVDGFERFERDYFEDYGGFIFKVTLLEYGYTFFGKGADDDHADKLAFEADVYERLEPIQGLYVPVILDEIDMAEIGDTYFYGIGIRLTYFLFMAWGGRVLDDARERRNEKFSRELRNALQVIHEHGVSHMDVRPANVLWDDMTERVTLVDFAEAILEKEPRPDLAPFIFVPKQGAKHGDTAANLATSDDEMECKVNRKWLDWQTNDSGPEDLFLL